MSEVASIATATATTAPAQAYARREWVQAFLGGICLSTLRRLERDPAKEFPRPLRFNKTPLYNMDEVRQWAETHRA